VTAIRADQGWRDITVPPKERADALLAALLAEEKIAVALGEFDKVAHLWVPALRYIDRPNGIRGPETMTAFPAALAFWRQRSTSSLRPVRCRDCGGSERFRIQRAARPAVDVARAPLSDELIQPAQRNLRTIECALTAHPEEGPRVGSWCAMIMNGRSQRREEFLRAQPVRQQAVAIDGGLLTGSALQ
jgi:hypothetical protein